MHLVDAFIQSDLYIAFMLKFSSMHASPGNQTHDLAAELQE